MRPDRKFRLFVQFLLCLLICFQGPAVEAAGATPAASAEDLRATLVGAQLALASDPAGAAAAIRDAEQVYQAALSAAIREHAPEADQRAREGFSELKVAGEDPAHFAAGRSQVWTAILWGSYTIMEEALQAGELGTARAWLPVREFRTATRFSLPVVDATLALESLAEGAISADEAIVAMRSDLLGAYQSRLDEALRALPDAQNHGFAIRRAELAALATGYFTILAPSYAEQRGEGELQAAVSSFAELQRAAMSGSGLEGALSAVDRALEGFRAAPLSPAERSRRAGQLLRFVGLIPVEYGRGVAGGRVVHDFEIQEAITFQAAAYAAFADLENLLAADHPDETGQADLLLARLGERLAQASQGQQVADPEEIRDTAGELAGLLEATIPEDWLKNSTQGDFDVIDSMLDQVEAAVQRGEYVMAESARLEAYAILESGPEARLIVVDPQLSTHLEGLFWNGYGEQKGLAYLIKNQAPTEQVRGTLTALAGQLAAAQELLGENAAPASIAANAGIIVFREGLEAVVILASLMSSLRRSEERKYRKSMWVGVVAALAVTVLTWLAAREVLQLFARYGEKLEAVVSLIAVGVLLVIMNWFFHKVSWTNWIAGFHSRKRQLLSGEAGLSLGLVALGFSSVYREGFEVVLFLQALVLDAGNGVVMAGTAVGLAVVALIGVIAFRMQVNLPYKKMLVITGILIGIVLFQIVGKTVYSLQVVGWAPVHPLQGLSLPVELGIWLGIYPTWEGIGSQLLAAGFVLGSYYLAEWSRRRQRLQAPPHNLPLQGEE